MVNAHNVLHWFRHTTSDSRLNVLCRLLDCCVPFELHFLSTYLQELLLRNMLFNKQSETTASIQYSDLNDLREITKSSSRRQLCILLTNLKSVNQLQAYNIYNILIQYDFNQFFSQVLSLEEEIVDEILLLFTLASNHPAMTFTQRSYLHQRLTELRDTIEKSFECRLMDVYSCDGQEYVYCPYNSDDSKKSKIKRELIDNLPKQLESEILEPTTTILSPSASKNEDNKGTTNLVLVHIKDMKVIKSQQRLSDKKYEYVFEITWTNGKVVRIHRSYGELFDFQCKLRRRHTKESGRVAGRRVIPYLPSRKPLKFCKGSDILPDITDYVSEFAQLPDRVLHSEWVEHFFSDGNERILDEPNQQKTKVIENLNKNLNYKQKESSGNVEAKSDKGNLPLKKCSPKGKCTILNFNKKSTTNISSSGKFDPKKRVLLSLKTTCSEPLSTCKDGNKLKTSTSSEVIIKTPNTIDQSTERKLRPFKKDHKQILEDHKKLTTNKKQLVPMTTKKPPVTMETGKPTVTSTTGDSPVSMTTSTSSVSTTTSKLSVSTTTTTTLPISIVTSKPSVSMTTNKSSVSMTTSTSSVSITTNGPHVAMATNKLPVSATKNGQMASLTTSSSVSMATSESLISVRTSEPFHQNLTKSASTSAYSACSEKSNLPNIENTSEMTSPLTVTVPSHSPLCTSCLTCNRFSSNESLVSLGSSLCSPVHPFIPSRTSSLSSPADQQHFDFTTATDMMTCSQETTNPVNLEICQLEKFENLFEDFTNDDLLNHCDSDKMTLLQKQKLKSSIHQLKSSQGTPINGFRANDVNFAQNGLLIVPNDYSNQQHYITQDDMMHGHCTINGPIAIVDKNYNFISQNGQQHHSSLDVNETHEYKQKTYLHEKSNGFCNPYCYNCGEYGHVGQQCFEKELEESLMT